MCLRERGADLLREVNHAAGGQRPEARDEVLEAEAVDVLHHVVEDAVGRAPVVVDGDRVGRVQAARELHLALEPDETVLAGAVGGEQLDRDVTLHHRVARAIHGAHAALADLRAERVLAELLRLARLLAEAEDRAGGERRGDDAEPSPHGRERGVEGKRKRVRRRQLAPVALVGSVDGRQHSDAAQDRGAAAFARNDDRAQDEEDEDAHDRRQLGPLDRRAVDRRETHARAGRDRGDGVNRLELGRRSLTHLAREPDRRADSSRREHQDVQRRDPVAPCGERMEHRHRVREHIEPEHERGERSTEARDARLQKRAPLLGATGYVSEGGHGEEEEQGSSRPRLQATPRDL